jgi:hypothetical protein
MKRKYIEPVKREYCKPLQFTPGAKRKAQVIDMIAKPVLFGAQPVMRDFGNEQRMI